MDTGVAITNDWCIIRVQSFGKIVRLIEWRTKPHNKFDCNLCNWAYDAFSRPTSFGKK